MNKTIIVASAQEEEKRIQAKRKSFYDRYEYRITLADGMLARGQITYAEYEDRIRRSLESLDACLASLAA